MIKLSIVIVSYNVKEYINQCIRSINRSNLNSESYEVIVVDNDSHDGSVDLIKKKFDNVLIYENKKNLGFSKAVNKGLKAAKGEYVCILNPDVIIQKNTFDILLNFCDKNNRIGAVGPKVLNSDGSIQHSCKRSFPTPINAFFRLLGLDKLFPKSKFFGKYNLTYIDIDSINEVDAISGAFMVIPNRVIKEVGCLDERFFMFGEDIDLCHRIKDAGYSVYYNPNTEIIHYKGESVKSAPYDMINIFYSAMDLYFKKYVHKYKYWRFINIFVQLGLFLRKIISYIKLLFNKSITLFLDTLIIVLSFCFSIYIWYTYQYNNTVNISTIFYHSLLILNFIISWYLSSRVIKTYKQNSFSYTRIFITLVMTLLISSTTTYFISIFAYSRGVLILSTFLSFIFLIGWRSLVKILYFYKIIKFKLFINMMDRRALIVGGDYKSFNIGEQINTSPETNINIIGYCDDENPLLIDNFLGKTEYIKDIVIKNNITEIIVREDHFKSNKIFNIIKKLNGLNLLFKIIPKENNIILGKGEIERISNIDLMSYEVPFLERSNILIKRIFDIALSFFLILLTSPIQFIFYFVYGKRKGRIWGLNGECINFQMININNRIICSLPILYKIFLGKMSFVGSQFISVNEKDPNNNLKPGLASLINTKKFKNNDSLRVENYYIRNQSLIFDIEIILKSLFRV